jgi:hypothetical protein
MILLLYWSKVWKRGATDIDICSIVVYVVWIVDCIGG